MSSSPIPAQKPSSCNRFIAADYFADIVTGEGPGMAVVHWIVQRAGSAEILMWGQEASHEAACTAAKSYLKNLARIDIIQTA